jgi:hypothetical protein
MSDNRENPKGTPQNYKMDRGGYNAQNGPFIGEVMNNIDPARLGRLQVYIDTFSGPNKDNETRWVTVNYLPPFYGYTQPSGTANGVGTYPGNPNAYGMWFTPPDIGIKVICIFVNGDRSLGYYIGVVPQDTLTHMIPAIGSTSKFETGNENQKAYFANAKKLPVAELNTLDSKIAGDPKFFTQAKPVQSVVAAAMFQQGLINDDERGPIQSSSQRESPSSVYGVSTPGLPIYQGGLQPNEIRKKLESKAVSPGDVKVIGRVGGHTLVMDDGDIEGNNTLFRLRTTKGHQITMSDSGDFFYIVHANGQTWMEFGAQGTVDVYSTNSINLRTQGDINLHADRDINMFAGGNVQIKSNAATRIEAVTTLTASAQEDMTLYCNTTVGVRADGVLTLNSTSGSWYGGTGLIFEADGIDLNGPSAGEVVSPDPITKTILPDTTFKTSTGWVSQPDALKSIVSRAPTHEPYAQHGLGVDVVINLEEGQPSPPPGAVVLPPGIDIQAE